MILTHHAYFAKKIFHFQLHALQFLYCPIVLLLVLARKKIPNIDPFRYIRKSDTAKPFQNELQKINHVTLANIIKDNKDKTHVIVYTRGRHVFAFLIFDDVGTHFHLNLVETNRIPESKTVRRPGTKLIKYVEMISTNYGYGKITVTALEDLTPFYEQMGYSISGSMKTDPTYGNVIEMYKDL